LISKKTGRFVKPGWLATNLFIAAVAVGAYHMYVTAVTSFHLYTGILPWKALLAIVLVYPLSVVGYLFPACGSVYLVAFLPLTAKLKDKRLRALLALMYMALIFGILMAATGFYTHLGQGRRNMWLLPFLIPPAGWLLADVCVWAEKHLPANTRFSWANLLAVIVILAGWATYDPVYRFSDATEYGMPEQDWKDMTQYLSKLPSTSLIVSGRFDAFQADPPGSNPYRYLGEGAMTDTSEASVMPYGATNMLFYSSFFTHTLLGLLDQPAAKELLQKTDRLVFLVTAQSGTPITNLIVCPTLDKEIIAFPPFAPGRILQKKDIMEHPATLMVIRKQTFFDEVVSLTGKAHSCLTGF
jgi:hypothetical protein